MGLCHRMSTNVVLFNFVKGGPETLSRIEDCILRVTFSYHYKNRIKTKAKLRVQWKKMKQCKFKIMVMYMPRAW